MRETIACSGRGDESGCCNERRDDFLCKLHEDKNECGLEKSFEEERKMSRGNDEEENPLDKNERLG